MSDERSDLIVALLCLCSDYHSGQWSRGYRLLCRIQTRYRPRNMPTTRDNLNRDEWESVAMIYDALEEKYSGKL